MKHHGCVFELEDERNEELLKLYHDMIDKAPFINMGCIAEEISNSPSSRFWVSAERASIVVSQKMKGVETHVKGEMKNEMFEEIYQRSLAMKKEHPDWSISYIVSRVVCQPAPKFYIKPSSIIVLLGRIRRKWYQKRKQKLRHLF